MKKKFIFVLFCCCLNISAQNVQTSSEYWEAPAAPKGTPGYSSFALPGKFTHHFYMNGEEKILHGKATITGSGLADDQQYDGYGREIYHGTMMKTSIEENWSHGKLHGPYTESFSAIGRKISGTYNKGYRDGTWVVSESGKTVVKEVYKDGRIIEQYEDGELRYKFENGKIVYIKGDNIDDELKDGIFVAFHSSREDLIKANEKFFENKDTLALNRSGWCFYTYKISLVPGSILPNMYVEDDEEIQGGSTKKGPYRYYKKIGRFNIDDSYLHELVPNEKEERSYLIWRAEPNDPEFPLDKYYLSHDEYKKVVELRNKYWEEKVVSELEDTTDIIRRDSKGAYLVFETKNFLAAPDIDTIRLNDQDVSFIKNSIIENKKKSLENLLIPVIKKEFANEFVSSYDNIPREYSLYSNELLEDGTYKSIIKECRKSVNTAAMFNKNAPDYVDDCSSIFFYYKLVGGKVVKDETKNNYKESDAFICMKYCRRSDAVYFNENGLFFINVDGLKLQISERQKNKIDKNKSK